MAAIPALNYPITGPPKPSPAPADGKATLLCTVHFAKFSGSVPLRREIRDLQHNFPDQWTLYILGLQAFQQLDEKSDLSWYGIAGMFLKHVSLYIRIFLTFQGIHGRPYRPWGGVQGDNPAGWQGYCTHSSILFAPWHRPYLALFEVGVTSLILLLNTHILTAIPVSNHTKDRCYVPHFHKGPLSTSCPDFPYAILGLGCCTPRW